MARSLGLHVIAEGVETEQQLDFLRKLDCDEFQGYLYSKPIPAEAFARLLGKPPVAGKKKAAAPTRRPAPRRATPARRPAPRRATPARPGPTNGRRR
jgi:predicted signal transduction protein with EAL and GGDEF domain